MEIEEKVQIDEKRLRDKFYGGGRISPPKALLLYEQERERKEEQEREKEELRKKMQERVHNYSHYVREMYFPKISQLKKDELENLKT